MPIAQHHPALECIVSPEMGLNGSIYCLGYGWYTEGFDTADLPEATTR
jgi:hypothetical protein